MAVGDAQDRDELLAAHRPMDLHLVADAYFAMRLGGGAIDDHLIQPAGLGRLGTGLVQTRDIEPCIETNASHRANGSTGSKCSQGFVRPEFLVPNAGTHVGTKRLELLE